MRFSPAHISLAHTSSAITRGFGPISVRTDRGSDDGNAAKEVKPTAQTPST